MAKVIPIFKKDDPLDCVNYRPISLLTNRKQFVSVNGYDSSQLEIKCGVPQGSTLSPLLFLVYINDLQFSLRYATPSHFADDTSIIYASKILKTIETNLNYDLKCVSEWLRSNRLSLNISKTKLLFFRSKNKTLPLNINIKIQGKRITPLITCQIFRYIC